MQVNPDPTAFNIWSEMCPVCSSQFDRLLAGAQFLHFDSVAAMDVWPNMVVEWFEVDVSWGLGGLLARLS